MPRGNHSNHQRGNQHYRWNNDKIVSSHGYAKIRVGRSHPLADPNGYAYEHLLVWIAAGNPKPTTDQLLHHINGNKLDNRIENLAILQRSAHSVMHEKGLTNEQVQEIRQAYADGRNNMQEMAEQYGVAIRRISKIIRGETRRNAGGPISTNNRSKHDAGRLLDGREWNEMPEGAL